MQTIILTKYENESCELRFTEIHIFRDDKYIADYDVQQIENDFKLIFKNVQNGDLANIKNILFVSDNYKTVLNFDSFELSQKEKIDYTLVGL